jgi:hypothetical protein
MLHEPPRRVNAPGANASARRHSGRLNCRHGAGLGLLRNYDIVLGYDIVVKLLGELNVHSRTDAPVEFAPALPCKVQASAGGRP